MLVNILRVFASVVVFVGLLWRYALSTSYLGFYRPHTFVRIWLAMMQALLLLVPLEPSAVCWMAVICIDLVYTQAVRNASRFVPIAVLASLLSWAFWLIGPWFSRGFAWSACGLATVCLLVVWPVTVGRQTFYVRPQKAKWLVPLFTLSALVACVLLSFGIAEPGFVFVFVSIMSYEWFYTWQFAFRSLMMVRRGQFAPHS
jgi:hypothetical protein